MAGVFEAGLRGKGVAEQAEIVMVNLETDVNPPARTCLESQEGGSSSRRRPQRTRTSYHRRAKYQPLVYQPRLTRPPIHPPPPPPPRAFNLEVMRLLFEKKLQNSDVSSTGRIVLPKREAEVHLPVLESKNGLWIHLDDMDYLHVWTFKFRFWPNNSSRMYLFENTRSLVEQHDLGVGDSIFLFKDDERGIYILRAKRDPMRKITHPPTENSIKLYPRLPFNYGVVEAEMSGVPVLVQDHQTVLTEDNANLCNINLQDVDDVPAEMSDVPVHVEDHQIVTEDNVHVGILVVDANPCNLLDVLSAEMSDVPVEEAHEAFTENNVHVNIIDADDVVLGNNWQDIILPAEMWVEEDGQTQTVLTENNIHVDIMNENPSNNNILQDIVPLPAEMSAVPVLEEHHQTTETEENTNGALTSSPLNLEDQFLYPPALWNSDSSSSYEFDHPMDDFFGTGMEMEPVYRHHRRSPSLDLDSINLSFFD